MNTKVTIAGVEFKNPVIAASGTFGFGEEYGRCYPLSRLGGICTKGLTSRERAGNPPPRIAETPSGILNSVGLQNPGIDYYLKNIDGRLAASGTVIIANIAGATLAEYEEMAEKVDTSSADMVELNISCPNVKAGGMAFGILPESVEAVTAAVRAKCHKPIITKLSPNVACIADNARAAEAAGADAVSLINTLTGMAVNLAARRPILSNNTGGLSGPCVKPIALRMVCECRAAVSCPIIGIGGIVSAEDALEFIMCGANAVEVGTANLSDPFAALKIVETLESAMKKYGVEDLETFRGTLKLNG